MATAPTPPSLRPANSRRTTVKQRRQQHVLDVAVRSTQAGLQRKRRFFGIVTRIMLALALGAGLYFGGKKAVAWLLLKNPEYNVADLSVETDGVLPPDVVLEAADLHKGGNIFLVNLTRAKARVESLPQVEKAQVVRQLPNRIAIQISERKPVAWIAPEHAAGTREEVTASKDSFLVDPRGILIPPANVSPQDAFLPIIRNYTTGPRSSGQEVEGEEIKAALDLLHSHQDSVIGARFQIQEIDLSKQFGLQVTDRNGLKVLFALDDMDRQLKRLDVALQAFDHRSEKVQTINLLAQKNVPVTFVTEPVAAEKLAEPPALPLAAAATPAKPVPLSKEKDKSKPKVKDNAKIKSSAKAKPVPPKHHENHAIQPFESEPSTH